MTDKLDDEYLFEVNFGGHFSDQIENMAQPEANCDCKCPCLCICISSCRCNLVVDAMLCVMLLISL